MFLKLVEDLRFVIGSLFGIISVLLLGVGFVDGIPAGADMNLNLMAGSVMFVFAAVMLGLSWAARHDVPEAPEEHHHAAAAKAAAPTRT